MKRYNSVYDGVYTKPNEMVEEPNGDWVRWEDVEQVLQLLSDSIEVTGKVGGIERQGGELLNTDYRAPFMRYHVEEIDQDDDNVVWGHA